MFFVAGVLAVLAQPAPEDGDLPPMKTPPECRAAHRAQKLIVY
jgi:hypothetical protein